VIATPLAPCSEGGVTARPIPTAVAPGETVGAPGPAPPRPDAAIQGPRASASLRDVRHWFLRRPGAAY